MTNPKFKLDAITLLGSVAFIGILMLGAFLLAGSGDEKVPEPIQPTELKITKTLKGKLRCECESDTQ